MARDVAAADDDGAAAAPRPGWTRERLKAFIARRYDTRVHMSLILSSCGLISMLASGSLLHLGVHSMLVRYPVAMAFAYATFLIGVWTWLRATGLGGAARPDTPAAARNAKGGSGDWLDLSGGGSGGSSAAARGEAAAQSCAAAAAASTAAGRAARSPRRARP